MATLTLVPADAPGDAPSARWEITIALDREGRMDEAAWHADPAPWMARLTLPDGSMLEGDLQAEPHGTWQLRVPPMPDAPIHAAFRPGKLVLGGILTLRRSNGAEEDWRVVGLG